MYAVVAHVKGKVAIHSMNIFNGGGTVSMIYWITSIVRYTENIGEGKGMEWIMSVPQKCVYAHTKIPLFHLYLGKGWLS